MLKRFLIVVSLGCSVALTLAENPEEKIVVQEKVVYETVTVNDFYVGDMATLAYELYESGGYEECANVLTKLADFALGEKNLAQNAAATKLLAKSEKNLRSLSPKLLTAKPPGLSEIEKALSQLNQGLVLSYGKTDNEALQKKIVAKDEKVVFSYLQAYNLQDVFELVTENWLAKKPKEAISKLDDAIKFVASEVEVSQTEEGKAALEDALAKLGSLKERLSQNKVKDESELSDTFTTTHEALALAYKKRSVLARFGLRKKRLQTEALRQTEAAQE